jgi:hypothetical protein
MREEFIRITCDFCGEELSGKDEEKEFLFLRVLQGSLQKITSLGSTIYSSTFMGDRSFHFCKIDCMKQYIESEIENLRLRQLQK